MTPNERLKWLKDNPNELSPIFYNANMVGRYVIWLMLLTVLYAFSLTVYQYLNTSFLKGNFTTILDYIKFIILLEPKNGNKELTAEPMTLILLIMGLILYSLKRYQQFYYGLLETFFAMLNCHFAVEAMKINILKGTVSWALIFVSGMTTLYLLVRGLVNTREGYERKFFLKKYTAIADIIINTRAYTKKADSETH